MFTLEKNYLNYNFQTNNYVKSSIYKRIKQVEMTNNK